MWKILVFNNYSNMVRIDFLFNRLLIMKKQNSYFGGSSFLFSAQKERISAFLWYKMKFGHATFGGNGSLLC
jgi:hypothetical protein